MGGGGGEGGCTIISRLRSARHYGGNGGPNILIFYLISELNLISSRYRINSKLLMKLLFIIYKFLINDSNISNL